MIDEFFRSRKLVYEMRLRELTFLHQVYHGDAPQGEAARARRTSSMN